MTTLEELEEVRAGILAQIAQWQAKLADIDRRIEAAKQEAEAA